MDARFSPITTGLLILATLLRTCITQEPRCVLSHLPCQYVSRQLVRAGANQYSIHQTRLRPADTGVIECNVRARDQIIRNISTIDSGTDMVDLFVLTSPGFPDNQSYDNQLLVEYNVQCEEHQVAGYIITDLDVQGRDCEAGDGTFYCRDYIVIDSGAFGSQTICGNTSSDSFTISASNNLSVIFRTSESGQGAGFYMLAACFDPTQVFAVSPTISLTSPTSSPIMAGDTVTLTCSVIATTPDLQWEGPGGVTPTPADPTTSGLVITSDLTLSEIATSQAGQYTCTATTITGAAATSASQNITVQIPVPTPSISVSRNSDVLYAGTTLSLTCDYTLSPSVDTTPQTAVTWMVDGVAVDTSPGRISTDGATLSFSPLATSDTGSYTCTLTVTTSQTHVTVQGPVQSAQQSLLVQECSVPLSSTEVECSPSPSPSPSLTVPQPPSPSLTIPQPPPDYTVAIIGGVVPAVLILAITLVVIFTIVVLVLKNGHSRDHSKTTEAQVVTGSPGIQGDGISIPTTTNSAYEVIKQQGEGESPKDECKVISGHPGRAPVKGRVSIPTTTNTAYEAIRQPEQGGGQDDYDIIISPPGGPPPVDDEIYDNPSSPVYSYIPVGPHNTPHGPTHFQ